MLTLARGSWGAALLPGQGAAFASLTRDGRDVLAPLPAGGDPTRLGAGAFVMAPWTNRLADGRLPLPDGGEQRFPINRPDEGNAIHGLSRDRPWRIAEREAHRARLEQSVSLGRYAYDAALEVALDGDGLALSLAVTSGAAGPLPFGIGWHPFLARTPGARVSFAATHRLLTDARNLPLRAEASDGLRDADPLGQDSHYAGWDGVAAVALDGLRLELRAAGAWARNLQLYAPAAKPVLALEPVSHAPDAAGRRWLDGLGPMATLAPGNTLAGSLTLRAA